MTYDNTNSGALFKNDRKETEKQPDYTGEWEDANGKKWRLAAWLRTSKGGKKYMSLKASEPQERKEPQGGQPEFNDDLPW